LLLLLVEVIARMAFPRVESLELFVATPQQRMQVASPQQSLKAIRCCSGG
jgi:hypothetical protein